MSKDTRAFMGAILLCWPMFAAILSNVLSLCGQDIGEQARAFIGGANLMILFAGCSVYLSR